MGLYTAKVGQHEEARCETNLLVIIAKTWRSTPTFWPRGLPDAASTVADLMGS